MGGKKKKGENGGTEKAPIFSKTKNFHGRKKKEREKKHWAVIRRFEILKMFYVRMDGWMGWMEWDGMDGTEYQKCPSIFFILCGYIDHVYIYL